MAVKDAVLQALENNKDTYISGEDLSRELGVSRAAVSKAVKALRSAGYEIDAVTNRGYMMPSEGTAVTEAAVRNALPASLRTMGVYVYDILDSTNLEARRLIAGDGASAAGAAIAAKAVPAVVICR